MARNENGEVGEAAMSVRDYLRWMDDPTSKTVLFEDSAALTGLLLAFTGIGLHQLTGSMVWDGLASIAIGLLLAGVAYLLGRNNLGLLIGTDQVLVCARVDFEDTLSAGELERVCVLLAGELSEQVHDVTEVFIEPVPRTDPELRATVLERYGLTQRQAGA